MLEEYIKDNYYAKFDTAVGVVKELCILSHWGVQLILAYKLDR